MEVPAARVMRDVRPQHPKGWVNKDAGTVQQLQLSKEFSSLGDRGLVTVVCPTGDYFVRGCRKKSTAVNPVFTSGAVAARVPAENGLLGPQRVEISF